MKLLDELDPVEAQAGAAVAGAAAPAAVPRSPPAAATASQLSSATCRPWASARSRFGGTVAASKASWWL